jgi:RNA polymerase sigma-70 factor (ECF subfamily)
MRDAGNDGSTAAAGPSRRELDAGTLAACRAGDPAAIRAFVIHYQGLVFAFLSRSLGRGPHVEDLAQEVFLRACRALPDFDGQGSARLSTWLLTIASRLAIAARRKRHVPTAPLDPELSGRSGLDSATPETERARRELGRALEAAAAQLPPDQRDAFVLAELHGLDMNELARVLDVPENTAKTRLFRARARLRELLRDIWEGA